MIFHCYVSLPERILDKWHFAVPHALQAQKNTTTCRRIRIDERKWPRSTGALLSWGASSHRYANKIRIAEEITVSTDLCKSNISSKNSEGGETIVLTDTATTVMPNRTPPSKTHEYDITSRKENNSRQTSPVQHYQWKKTTWEPMVFTNLIVPEIGTAKKHSLTWP